MLIGGRGRHIILEFQCRKVILQKAEFDELVDNLRGKLTGDVGLMMKTNAEILNDAQSKTR